MKEKNQSIWRNKNKQPKRIKKRTKFIIVENDLKLDLD